TPIYTLSLHDALPISHRSRPDFAGPTPRRRAPTPRTAGPRRETAHTSTRRPAGPGPAPWHAGSSHRPRRRDRAAPGRSRARRVRSEEHTSELQSLAYL